MKFAELFETPTFMDREWKQINAKVEVMSVNTLDRNYDLLGHTTVGDDKVVAAIKKDHTSAIIGRVNNRDDGVKAVEIIVSLTFHEDDSDSPGVEKLNNPLHVDSVYSVSEKNGAGYGYFLYKALLDAGFTLVSDNVQYLGGKALWMKIVRRAARDDHSVYILQNGELIKDENGRPIVYDGTNIPDDVIWSTKKTSKEHYYTLLVATNN